MVRSYHAPTEDAAPQVEALALSCLRNCGYMVYMGGGHTFVSAEAFDLYQYLFERLAAGGYEEVDNQIVTRIRPIDVATEFGWNPSTVRTALQLLVTRGIAACDRLSGRSWTIRLLVIERMLEHPSRAPERDRGMSSYPRVASFVEKHGAICPYCKKQGTAGLGPDGNRWVRDHVVPRSRGGRDTASNLTLACWTCNSRKGVMSAEDFLAKLAEEAASV